MGIPTGYLFAAFSRVTRTGWPAASPRAGAGLALCWCLLLWLPCAARAEGDTLYGALVMATNEEAPKDPPPELRAQAENLTAIFGYNQFRLLGQRYKPLVTATEDWLVSGHQFFLKIDTKNPVMGGYALNVQLRKEKQVLVEAEVKLSRERPLFIRGPFVGKGQLIILLMVQ